MTGTFAANVDLMNSAASLEVGHQDSSASNSEEKNAEHFRGGDGFGKNKGPFRVLDPGNLTGNETVDELISNGKLYWNHLRKTCKYYRGEAKEFPHNKTDGLAMIDIDAYYEVQPNARPMTMDSMADDRTWVSDCICSYCNRNRDANQEKKAAIFNDYVTIPPKTRKELGDAQYIFLPTYTQLLHVKGLDEPKFEEDMIDQLRAVVSGLFVKGKGNGLIFLLHGSPGTGKTCTAECIATFTNRPLMVLTSSDTDTQPSEVEKNLTDHFKRARSWGAVLLIDEANAFMERRSTADLTRNSLVAGFLRALEFYDGILFLTTNRVGLFNDAFISRIHVQLRYPDLTGESRRKVWQTFIDKLQRERGDYIRLNIDAKEYLDGKELKSVNWNG